MVDHDVTFAYRPVVSARAKRGAAGQTQRPRIGTDGLYVSTLTAGIYYLDTIIDGQRTIQRHIKP